MIHLQIEVTEIDCELFHFWTNKTSNSNVCPVLPLKIWARANLPKPFCKSANLPPTISMSAKILPKCVERSAQIHINLAQLLSKSCQNYR